MTDRNGTKALERMVREALGLSNDCTQPVVQLVRQLADEVAHAHAILDAERVQHYHVHERPGEVLTLPARVRLFKDEQAERLADAQIEANAADWRAAELAQHLRHTLEIANAARRAATEVCPECTAATDALAQESERALDYRTHALAAIAAERERQVEIEGFDGEHDDTVHDSGDISAAAAAYAMNAAALLNPYNLAPLITPPDCWPWAARWWKPAYTPANARRDLVKAAALIVAELERMDREAHGAPETVEEREE